MVRARGRRPETGVRWRRRYAAFRALGALGLWLAASLLHPASAEAAPPSAASTSPQKANPKKTKPAPRPRAKGRVRATSTSAAPTGPAAASGAGASSVASPAAAPKVGATKAAEVPVGGPEPAPANEVVKTEETREGEKTYTFGAQEVEGRLKSPQILYFLRRVRAQFDPAPLGHRSFLLELSDTRRHPAFE